MAGNDLASVIAAAAQRYGVNPTTLTGIGRIESGLNPNAQNPRSSAGGLFQFIDSTAGRYGLTNKFDPAMAADAAARLTRDNTASLAKVLGRDPTPGEIYLAHQQGAGGAAKLLSNPDAPAASIVGQKAVSLNGGQPGETAGQFAGHWTQKLNAAIGAPVSPAATPTAAQVPQAGTQLAAALPGATLPTAAVVLPPPDPVSSTVANVGQQELLNQQAQAAKTAQDQARRTALFSGGRGLGRMFG
jgi:hypothetical protein